MRFVAFFRAINFGHAGSPSKAEFVTAFAEAGAVDPASLQTHGNAVFSAGNEQEAAAVASAACERLRREYGRIGAVYTRSLRHLAELVASEPFACGPQDDVYERCVTFLPVAVAEPTLLPILSPRRDVEVFRMLPAEAFSVSRMIGKSPGNVNGLLERLLGVPLTTRNWNTIIRLVDRYGTC